MKSAPIGPKIKSFMTVFWMTSKNNKEMKNAPIGFKIKSFMTKYLGDMSWHFGLLHGVGPFRVN